LSPFLKIPITLEVPLPIPDLTAPAPRPTADPALPKAALVFVPPDFIPLPILLPIPGPLSTVSVLTSGFFCGFFSTVGVLPALGVSLSCDLSLKTIFGLSESAFFFSLYSFRAGSAVTESGSESPNRSSYLSSRLLPRSLHTRLDSELLIL